MGWQGSWWGHMALKWGRMGTCRGPGRDWGPLSKETRCLHLSVFGAGLQSPLWLRRPLAGQVNTLHRIDRIRDLRPRTQPQDPAAGLMVALDEARMVHRQTQPQTHTGCGLCTAPPAAQRWNCRLRRLHFRQSQPCLGPSEGVCAFCRLEGHLGTSGVSLNLSFPPQNGGIVTSGLPTTLGSCEGRWCWLP